MKILISFSFVFKLLVPLSQVSVPTLAHILNANKKKFSKVGFAGWLENAFVCSSAADDPHSSGVWLFFFLLSTDTVFLQFLLWICSQMN